jgi:cytochrome oxidase Cu insertion factor (SCO1/SenC/PrrC family)
MVRAILIVAALTALIAGALGVWYWRVDGPMAEPATTGRALIGGPFSLVNQDGERVTEADFAGRYKLIFFGYTYCPDYCPMNLVTMTRAIDLLEPELAERVVPIFISVDPERDTVAHLKDYAALFHPRLVALTGTPEEVDAAARAYRVYYSRAAPDGSTTDYLVDHSIFTYLMGPDGAYVTHFGHDATPEAMAERLREQVAVG